MSKIGTWLLRLPMWALVIGSCIAAYYAVYAQLIEGLTWKVPGIYTVILIMYLVGVMIKDDDVESEE